MKHDAVVTKVTRHAPHIVTVYFTLCDGDAPVYPFTAGQYLSVYFDETGVREGKAYSISATPWDDELAITVKDVSGPFSSRLCALKPGNHLTVSSPFGFFNVHDDTPITAIAAGVGVSPILSIIRDELKKDAARPISLYFTAPHENELVFRPRIDELFSIATRAQAHYFVTREKSSVGLSRRFSVSDDVSSSELAASRFYVCGADTFVRAMWCSLMEAGVDETRVVTETFFESAL